jgi:hypothetical protein
MSELYKTKTGIEIGCMYQKPMPQPTPEEELIQSALLHARGPDYVSIVAYVILLCVTCGLVFVLVRSGL